MIESFKEGVHHGKFIEFNEIGTSVIEGQYVDDKKDGAWYYRQGDGKILRREEYKAGRPFGTWTEYYPNGRPQSEKNYNKNGVLEGKFARYDRSGKTIYEAVYSNGKLAKVVYQTATTM